VAREKKGGSPITLGRQSRRRRRTRGARGMMNIKAGQAVRVDSTLSAQASRAKKKLRSILFMREATRTTGLNAGGRTTSRMNTGLTRQGGAVSRLAFPTSHPFLHRHPLCSLYLHLSPFLCSFSLSSCRRNQEYH